jgi:hypothetical protein
MSANVTLNREAPGNPLPTGDALTLSQERRPVIASAMAYGEERALR